MYPKFAELDGWFHIHIIHEKEKDIYIQKGSLRLASTSRKLHSRHVEDLRVKQPNSIWTILVAREEHGSEKFMIQQGKKEKREREREREKYACPYGRGKQKMQNRDT